MMSFVAVSVLDGTVISYLTDITAQGQVASTIGRYEQLTFLLPPPKECVDWYSDWLKEQTTADPPLQILSGWLASFTEGAVVIVALDENDHPIQGYLVINSEVDQDGVATIQTVTLEAYFDRRYVNTAYSQVSRRQDLIIADLIDAYIVDGTLPGLPIRVDNTASAKSVAAAYKDADDKTIYSIFTAMSAAQGGPEWTVTWEWQHTPERITPVLRVADRLGSAPLPAFAPKSLWSMPGCVSAAKVIRDYSSGQGANRVTATAPGAGLVRFQVMLAADDYLGRPTFEYRDAPSTTITIPPALIPYAQAWLAAMVNGGRALQVDAAIADAPVLGVDWEIGDDAMVDITGPAWLDGSLQGRVIRIVGWKRDDNIISPVFTSTIQSTIS